ncbi:hypothetical protein L1049_001036 [Liquidambar formosana]|uniref:Uncharacterized protein n=1 Tax=Liquidambar formosana TaxID=63359 RepID=A0AAP0R844_LIQFO
MAFDQNTIPKDLRPLNVARTMAEEPRIAPATSTGRNAEGFFPNPARDVGNPGSIPVYHPTMVPDSGFVGLSYGNQAAGVAATWCPQVPAVVGHVGVNPAIGFGYNPNLGARAGGNNAADQASDEGGDDLSKKVKFLCSFGGKILPRPSDGMLRYVGGQTRIISVRRDVSFSELVTKDGGYSWAACGY